MSERFRVTERARRRRLETSVNRRHGYAPISRPAPEILQRVCADFTPGKLRIRASHLLSVREELEKLMFENYDQRILPLFQIKMGDVTHEITHEVIPCGERINIFSGFVLMSRPNEKLEETHFEVYKHLKS